jgi:hypothetical protein
VVVGYCTRTHVMPVSVAPLVAPHATPDVTQVPITREAIQSGLIQTSEKSRAIRFRFAESIRFSSHVVPATAVAANPRNDPNGGNSVARVITTQSADNTYDRSEQSWNSHETIGPLVPSPVRPKTAGKSQGVHMTGKQNSSRSVGKVHPASP